MNLRVKDVGFEDLSLHIKGAKGGKDRISIFSKRLVDDLEEKVKNKNLNDFVFITERGGKYTTRTLQMIFKKSLSFRNRYESFGLKVKG